MNVPESTIRTQQEALNEALAIRNTLFQDSKKCSISIAKEISLVAGNITKADSDGHFSASAYIINFGENSGFALIRADKAYTPVIAVTEIGALDASKFFNLEAEFSDVEERFYYHMLEDAITADDFGTPSYSNGLPPSEYSYIGTQGMGPADPSLTELNEWAIDITVGPICQTKWGQAYPFNKYVPTAPASSVFSTNYYNYRYPAGCTMVAMGQLCVANGRPVRHFGPNHLHYLSSFSTVSDYNNYSLFCYPSYDLYVTDSIMVNRTEGVAKLLSDLGDQAGADHGETGTGAWPENLFPYLASIDSFYHNYEKIPCNTSAIHTDIDDLLDASKPVVFVGFSSGSSGHTWLIDGYVYRHKNVSHVLSLTEHLFHFNMGWRGVCDGYYNLSYISNTNRQYTDSIDTNEGTNSFNYVREFYYYLY